jgi:hypothetical protein
LFHFELILVLAAVERWPVVCLPSDLWVEMHFSPPSSLYELSVHSQGK